MVLARLHTMQVTGHLLMVEAALMLRLLASIVPPRQESMAIMRPQVSTEEATKRLVHIRRLAFLRRLLPIQPKHPRRMTFPDMTKSSLSRPSASCKHTVSIRRYTE